MSVAVLVNAHARHGSASLADSIRDILPEARTVLTRSLDQAKAWVREELVRDRPEVLLAAGGDGTAVALLNELRAHDLLGVPAFGLLPVGTGNGWARATGEVGPRAALRGLVALRDLPFPSTRDFGLVETEGRLTPFAGTGWDAEILADYKHVLAGTREAFRRKLDGNVGYVRSILGRTLPRQLRRGSSRSFPVKVKVTNLGAPALSVDADGVPVPVSDGGYGAVVYEGPMSVGGASTTETLGLGFRAFPFAHLVPGRMAVRIYGASAMEAAARLPRIWRGRHPVPHDFHFLLTRCRFEFDRPVPFEIGGDLAGERTRVELSLVENAVRLVDWRNTIRRSLRPPAP